MKVLVLSTSPCPKTQNLPHRATLTPHLPRHNLQHSAGLLGTPIVLWETWGGRLCQVHSGSSLR